MRLINSSFGWRVDSAAAVADLDDKEVRWEVAVVVLVEVVAAAAAAVEVDVVLATEEEEEEEEEEAFLSPPLPLLLRP